MLRTMTLNAYGVVDKPWPGFDAKKAPVCLLLYVFTQRQCLSLPLSAVKINYTSQGADTRLSLYVRRSFILKSIISIFIQGSSVKLILDTLFTLGFILVCNVTLPDNRYK